MLLVFRDQFVTFVRWSLVSCPGFGLRVIRRLFERPNDHPVLCGRAGASLSAEKQPPQQIFRSWRGLVDPESFLNHSVLAVFHGWCVLNVVLIDLFIYFFNWVLQGQIVRPVCSLPSGCAQAYGFACKFSEHVLMRSPDCRLSHVDAIPEKDSVLQFGIENCA